VSSGRIFKLPFLIPRKPECCSPYIDYAKVCTIRGSKLGMDKKFFSSPKKHPDCLWDLPSLLFSGYRVCFPEVKRPDREFDDDSFPSMAEVKNEWSSSPTPPPTLSWLLQGKMYKKLICFIIKVINFLEPSGPLQACN